MAKFGKAEKLYSVEINSSLYTAMSDGRILKQFRYKGRLEAPTIALKGNGTGEFAVRKLKEFASKFEENGN